LEVSIPTAQSPYAGPITIPTAQSPYAGPITIPTAPTPHSGLLPLSPSLWPLATLALTLASCHTHNPCAEQRVQWTIPLMISSVIATFLALVRMNRAKTIVMVIISAASRAL